VPITRQPTRHTPTLGSASPYPPPAMPPPPIWYRSMAIPPPIWCSTWARARPRGGVTFSSPTIKTTKVAVVRSPPQASAIALPHAAEQREPIVHKLWCKPFIACPRARVIYEQPHQSSRNLQLAQSHKNRYTSRTAIGTELRHAHP